MTRPRVARKNVHLDIVDPSISVVVPTYYRPMELSELLDSILGQTRKPMEIIIVDDTPIPSIKLVCEQYEKAFQEIGVNLLYVKRDIARWRGRANPKERSISSARNFGAIIAKGDIVQFIDSDIVLTPSYLREVQKTFEEHSEALGVEGITIPIQRPPAGVGENAVETIAKLFFLFHPSRNTCKHFEFPLFLDKEIRCEWFNGPDMAFRKGVLSQFQFDENLVKYSFMECVLFTGLIDKAYPGRLILTPEAKFYENRSEEGRMKKSEIRIHKDRCRKYVLTKLFGSRGLLLFGWQNLGLLVLRTIGRIRGKDFDNAMM
jgi:glycosyltransferase involved in cell wall biosynthesis